MSAWLDAAKQQIESIMAGVEVEIKKQYGQLKIEFRFGALVYRDVGDSGHLDACRFSKDIKAVKDFICRQKAVGGGDLPEDVLAAMNAVADWDDWNARARFVVLIGDAPAHGKECTDDPSDKYPNGPPHNLTVQQVIKKIKDKHIDLMFCRLKRDYTLKMEQAIRSYYDDAKENKRLATTDLFDASNTSEVLYHFVMVLDESGSMSGQPWSELMRAYMNFLSQRCDDQHPGDKISVITFNDAPYVQITLADIRAAQRNLNYRSGGTSFAPAVQAASQVIGQGDPSLRPIVIFMSDGQADDATSTVSSLHSQYQARGLKFNTVAFGSGAGTTLLQSMANAGGGQLFTASSGIQLSECFAAIGQQCRATQGLVDMLSKKISEMIATKIVVDFI